MSRQRKSSVDIPEAVRPPRVTSSNYSCIQSTDNFNVFKNKNAVSPLHDFKVSLTSVQGKLELLDSSNSNQSSNFSRS